MVNCYILGVKFLPVLKEFQVYKEKEGEKMGGRRRMGEGEREDNSFLALSMYHCVRCGCFCFIDAPLCLLWVFSLFWPHFLIVFLVTFGIVLLYNGVTPTVPFMETWMGPILKG